MNAPKWRGSSSCSSPVAVPIHAVKNDAAKNIALAGSGPPRQAGGLRQPPVLFARCARGASFHFQVLCRRLAAIAHDLVFHLLAFIECAEPCALYSRDVNKHVLAATLRLNEAVALGGVEPFHSSDRHQDSPSLLIKTAPTQT